MGEHTLSELVSIREMLLFFGKDQVCSPTGPPSMGAYFQGIRSCQNPIGRAQPKNGNLWFCHIKQSSGKKLIEFDVDWIEIGDNPIGA